MATKKPTVSPRIANPEFYDKYFPNRNNGCQLFLDAIPTLFELELNNLKGVFTRLELALIVDVSNGFAPTPQMCGQGLYGQVADACALDAIDKKWVVNKDELLGKIDGLSLFQRAVLEVWGVGFWYGNWKSGGNLAPGDLEKWVSRLE